MIRHRFVVAAALLAASGAAACATDGPTAPEPAVSAAPTALNAAVLTSAMSALTGVVAEPVSWADQTLSESQLKRVHEGEKKRLDLAKKASQPKYDSLKVVWDAFKKLKVSKTASPFLMCDPLQFTGDTKVMGPEGGDLSVGPHKLRIPRGALTKRTVITAEIPVTTEVQVRLYPHGLKFAKGADLELSYKHCYVPGVNPNEAAKSVVYVNNALQILEWPLSLDLRHVGLAHATIDHFSGYAVAWSRTRR